MQNALDRFYGAVDICGVYALRYHLWLLTHFPISLSVYILTLLYLILFERQNNIYMTKDGSIIIICHLIFYLVPKIFEMKLDDEKDLYKSI